MSRLMREMWGVPTGSSSVTSAFNGFAACLLVDILVRLEPVAIVVARELAEELGRLAWKPA